MGWVQVAALDVGRCNESVFMRERRWGGWMAEYRKGRGVKEGRTVEHRVPQAAEDMGAVLRSRPGSYPWAVGWSMS